MSDADDLLTAAIPSSADVTTALTADAVRAATARLREHVIRPPEMIVGPHLHDRACDLLGVPHGTPLTQADMWRAADVEVRDMTPAERERLYEDISRFYAAQRGW